MSTTRRGPEMVLVRHGETAWTRTGQHTSRTDIALTATGRTQAERLAPLLASRRFGLVLTSPRQRAADTCALAGFADDAEVADDLAEWDYGDYEGRTTADIRADEPSWSLWRDGAPRGETIEDVAARVDRVITRVRDTGVDAIAFAHGHVLRVLAARWLDQPADAGRLFALVPASISVLGWEREQPVLTLWNATDAS